jgi:hypothetical protein
MMQCLICGKYHTGQCPTETGYCPNGIGGYIPYYPSPPAQQIYTPAPCGGHCWCKEKTIEGKEHLVCCNCGLYKLK